MNSSARGPRAELEGTLRGAACAASDARWRERLATLRRLREEALLGGEGERDVALLCSLGLCVLLGPLCSLPASLWPALHTELGWSEEDLWAATLEAPERETSQALWWPGAVLQSLWRAGLAPSPAHVARAVAREEATRAQPSTLAYAGAMLAGEDLERALVGALARGEKLTPRVHRCLLALGASLAAEEKREERLADLVAELRDTTEAYREGFVRWALEGLPLGVARALAARLEAQGLPAVALPEGDAGSPCFALPTEEADPELGAGTLDPDAVTAGLERAKRLPTVERTLARVVWLARRAPDQEQARLWRVVEGRLGAAGQWQRAMLCEALRGAPSSWHERLWSLARRRGWLEGAGRLADETLGTLLRFGPPEERRSAAARACALSSSLYPPLLRCVASLVEGLPGRVRRSLAEALLPAAVVSAAHLRALFVVGMPDFDRVLAVVCAVARPGLRGRLLCILCGVAPEGSLEALRGEVDSLPHLEQRAWCLLALARRGQGARAAARWTSVLETLREVGASEGQGEDPGVGEDALARLLESALADAPEDSLPSLLELGCGLTQRSSRARLRRPLARRGLLADFEARAPALAEEEQEDYAEEPELEEAPEEPQRTDRERWERDLEASLEAAAGGGTEQGNPWPLVELLGYVHAATEREYVRVLEALARSPLRQAPENLSLLVEDIPAQWRDAHRELLLLALRRTGALRALEVLSELGDEELRARCFDAQLEVAERQSFNDEVGARSLRSLALEGSREQRQRLALLLLRGRGEYVGWATLGEGLFEALLRRADAEERGVYFSALCEALVERELPEALLLLAGSAPLWRALLDPRGRALLWQGLAWALEGARWA